MPVDFITIPFAILGVLLLVIRLAVFRLNTPPRLILVLNWVLFAPYLLGVVLPLVVLHVLSLFGSTGAMMSLGGLYRSGLNGNFIMSEGMSLHYYDEAIARGSVEAMLLKSDELAFDLKRKWINSQREFIGIPDSPMYKSKEWTEAFDLAKKAADTGTLQGVHRVHKLSLMPNPHAYGEGVYLIQKTTDEALRRHANGTEQYKSYLYQSDGWKHGMSLLAQESADAWVRDFYFIALLKEHAGGGNEACKKLLRAFERHSGEPLGMGRDLRAKIAGGTEWQSAMQTLEDAARRGDPTAAELLSRAQEFISR